MRTTSINNNVYSVDMMFSYINIFKPESITVPVQSLHVDFDQKGWGDGDISVNDVLNNPTRYKEDYERITNCNMKYPIIITKNGKTYRIIDGVHRVIYCKINDKKSIKAYIFDAALLKKFLLNNRGDYDTVVKPNIFIELFVNRFIDLVD